MLTTRQGRETLKECRCMSVGAVVINEPCYQFGPTAFSNHVKVSVCSRKEEVAIILLAAERCGDSWMPWSWIKDMSLLCENEFCSVYTAYINPLLVDTNTIGWKAYIRKVTDINIVMKVSRRCIMLFFPLLTYLLNLP